MLIDIRQQFPIIKNTDIREIDAGKRIKTSGMRFACACSGDDMAVEHHMCSAGSRVRGIREGLIQVAAGVAVGLLNGFLCTGKHNGLQIVLHQIRQRRRGIGHGIRTVCDHKAVIPIVAFADDLRQMDPLFPAHIGAVQTVRLDRIHQTERADIRYSLQKFFRCERRR